MTTIAPTHWEMYIGPQWQHKDYAQHWDHSTIASGNLGGFTLASNITIYSATVPLTSSITLPSKGGIWLGPGATNEKWEYIEYGSKTGSNPNITLGTLYRNNLLAHTAGATGYMWYPVTTNDGRLHFTHKLDSNLVVADWTAYVTGVLAPKAIIRNRHSVLIRTRNPGGSWANFLLGWIDGYQVEDDYQRLARWRIEIVSIGGMLAKTKALPLRTGTLDVLRAGQVVDQDQALTYHIKEMASGDIVSTNADLTAKAAIDGDDNTPAIFDRVLGSNPESITGTNARITAFYINRAPGEEKGFRWIEVTFTQSLNIGEMSLVNGSTYAEYPASKLILTIGGTSKDSQDKILIVEDEDKWRTRYPIPVEDSDVATIYAPTVSTYGTFQAWFDRFNLTDGVLAIRMRGKGGVGDVGWGETVAWGTNKEPYLYTDEDDDYGPLMDGGAITAPAAGKTYRWNGSAYVQDYIDSPGLRFSETGDTFIHPWACFKIPEMGLTLRSALTNSATGWTDINHGAIGSTNGLPSSGTIQIGAEQITYSAKSATQINISARGANSTTAAAHDAGDPILVVVNSVATGAFPIKEIRIKTPTGKPYLSIIRIGMANTVVVPLLPEKQGQGTTMYRTDYSIVNAAYDVSNPSHTAYWDGDRDVFTLPISSARANYLLVECVALSTMPNRPRLSTVEVILDNTTFDSTWLGTGTTIQTLVSTLLGNVGIPSGAYSFSGSNRSQALVTNTAHEAAWSVLADICDFTSLQLTITPMSLLQFIDARAYDADYNSPSTTWTRSNARKAATLTDKQGAVAQVELPWSTPDGVAQDTILYPSTIAATEQGMVQTLKPTVYPNSSVAQEAAIRRYTFLRWPYTIAVEPDVPNLTSPVTLIHTLQWDFPTADLDIDALVTSCDLVIEGGYLSSALRLLPISQEVIL